MKIFCKKCKFFLRGKKKQLPLPQKHKTQSEMNTTISIKAAADYAARCTKITASVKGWRLRTKIDRRLHAFACELARGKGYIICTPAELSEITGIATFAKCCEEQRHQKIICGVLSAPANRGSLKGYMAVGIAPFYV